MYLFLQIVWNIFFLTSHSLYHAQTLHTNINTDCQTQKKA